MIGLGLVELGFTPLVDFVVSDIDGAVTLTWLSELPQPTPAAITAAAVAAQQKITAEQTRVQEYRSSTTRAEWLQRLRTATPAQISNYVDNQVVGTTAQQVTAVKNILKGILLAIALDARN